MLGFSVQSYNEMIARLFVRFPSFQKIGSGAYKPGIANMVAFDRMLGVPHTHYATIHVAGTNGKGSVSNMLASVCAAMGLKTGLYTSPHILDFRERMRIIDADGRVGMISREAVWDFVQKWRNEMEGLDLSFFEITTAMAFDWFAGQGVDVAVIETGLGGRLDSTNIITPLLSVITNIGMDHCDMLGNTLGQIAAEKAGIIKRGVSAVVGESDPQTDPVFIAKSLAVNSPDGAASFAPGDSSAVSTGAGAASFAPGAPSAVSTGAGAASFAPGAPSAHPLLTFADKVEPWFWDRAEEIVSRMDLQGDYQRKNLRTVLASIERLPLPGFPAALGALSAATPAAPALAAAHRASVASSVAAPALSTASIVPTDSAEQPTQSAAVSAPADSAEQPTQSAAVSAPADSAEQSTQSAAVSVPADPVEQPTQSAAVSAPADPADKIVDALEHTAARTHFHGRWEKLSDNPLTIADIGHNSHGLKPNFAQLERMMRSGRFSSLHIIYATMADKDVDTIMSLLPREADYYFVTASNKRALPAEDILRHYLAAGGDASHARCCSLQDALKAATEDSRSLVYVGGSAYLVSEVCRLYNSKPEE